MLLHLQMLDNLGFSSQFTLSEHGLESLTTDQLYRPEEVSVVNFYAFEDEPMAEDGVMVYAIKTTNGERGTLQHTLGAKDDLLFAKWIRKCGNLEKNPVNSGIYPQPIKKDVIKQ